MRVAVIGGTGLVGRHTIRALQHAGHDAIVVARSTGTDVTTGVGLDDALAGVEAVVDVTNTLAQSAEAAREFFATSTGHLLAAEQRAAVGHHVVLSIVGVDRVEGNAHYAGKRRQEELALAGPIPATVVRATQFHEFAAMVVDWARQGDVATVPPLLVQPVAASDVGDVLAEVATRAPHGGRLSSPDPKPRIWSTWPGVPWRPAGSRSGCSRAGGLARSVSRWLGRSCYPDQVRDSHRPPSTPGLPPKPRPQRDDRLTSSVSTPCGLDSVVSGSGRR
jgi:hypothetical protein